MVIVTLSLKLKVSLVFPFCSRFSYIPLSARWLLKVINLMSIRCWWSLHLLWSNFLSPDVLKSSIYWKFQSACLPSTVRRNTGLIRAISIFRASLPFPFPFSLPHHTACSDVARLERNLRLELRCHCRPHTHKSVLFVPIYACIQYDCSIAHTWAILHVNRAYAATNTIVFNCLSGRRTTCILFSILYVAWKTIVIVRQVACLYVTTCVICGWQQLSCCPIEAVILQKKTTVQKNSR